MKKLLVIVLAFVSFSVNAQDTLTKSFEDSVIVEFTNLLNQYRRYSKNIFTKIENSSEYNATCKKHSEYQASIHTVTHDRADNSKFMNLTNLSGHCENCTATLSGLSAKQTASNLFISWKTSQKGHQRNLNNTELTKFGLGLALSDDGWIYATYQAGN